MHMEHAGLSGRTVCSSATVLLVIVLPVLTAISCGTLRPQPYLHLCSARELDRCALEVIAPLTTRDDADPPVVPRLPQKKVPNRIPLHKPTCAPPKSRRASEKSSIFQLLVLLLHSKLDIDGGGSLGICSFDAILGLLVEVVAPEAVNTESGAGCGWW